MIRLLTPFSSQPPYSSVSGCRSDRGLFRDNPYQIAPCDIVVAPRSAQETSVSFPKAMSHSPSDGSEFLSTSTLRLSCLPIALARSARRLSASRFLKRSTSVLLIGQRPGSNLIGLNRRQANHELTSSSSRSQQQSWGRSQAMN